MVEFGRAIRANGLGYGKSPNAKSKKNLSSGETVAARPICNSVSHLQQEKIAR